jgi:hypothetical protein
VIEPLPVVAIDPREGDNLMNWLSEAAVIWLPKDAHAYPEQFAQRAAPGSNDFYYFAVDAFASVFDRIHGESEREPWIYLLDDKRLLSPTQIKALAEEWATALSQFQLSPEPHSGHVSSFDATLPE